MTVSALTSLLNTQSRFAGVRTWGENPPKKQGERYVVEDDYGNRHITVNLGNGTYGKYSQVTNPGMPKDDPAVEAARGDFTRALLVSAWWQGKMGFVPMVKGVFRSFFQQPEQTVPSA